MNSSNSRAGERGAVSIKTILTVFVVASVAFVIMKIAPVYIEQRKIIYDVEELARIAAVRNFKDDKITAELGRIRGSYELPEGSINLTQHNGQIVQIAITYTRSVDLLVTTYSWKVEHTIVGKDL